MKVRLGVVLLLLVSSLEAKDRPCRSWRSTVTRGTVGVVIGGLLGKAAGDDRTARRGAVLGAGVGVIDDLTDPAGDCKEQESRVVGGENSIGSSKGGTIILRSIRGVESGAVIDLLYLNLREAGFEPLDAGTSPTYEAPVRLPAMFGEQRRSREASSDYYLDLRVSWVEVHHRGGRTSYGYSSYGWGRGAAVSRESRQEKRRLRISLSVFNRGGRNVAVAYRDVDVPAYDARRGAYSIDSFSRDRWQVDSHNPALRAVLEVLPHMFQKEGRE